MFHLKETRGFIFPFVMFFVSAGSFIVAGIFSFETTQSSYDALMREQTQIQENLSSEARIFETLLQKTNSNKTGLTATGADNDNYNKTGSGGSGIDDDEDAFVYKIGMIESGMMKNILYLNPTYNYYASIFTFTDLTEIKLTSSSTGMLTLYKLDVDNRMLKKANLPLVVGSNTINLNDWNNANGLALFLKNDTGGILQYKFSGVGGNIVGAKNLGSGNYQYYANVLIPKDNGAFSSFAKVFTK